MRFMPKAPMTNDHLLELQKHFGTIAGRGSGAARIRLDTKHVFVCFTNRCGSNFVAGALGSNGFLNTAGEFFNADTVIENCAAEKLGCIGDFVNWLTARAGKNGFLASKIAIGHLEVLAEAGILDKILDNSSFVMIERGDKLGQAISYDIARQTGRWTSSTAGAMADDELEFSRDRLVSIITAISKQNQAFAQFFGLNGIVPALINYEQFAENPAYFVDHLARFLKLPEISFVAERLGVQKQAGPLNQAWRERYERDDLAG